MILFRNPSGILPAISSVSSLLFRYYKDLFSRFFPGVLQTICLKLLKWNCSWKCWIFFSGILSEISPGILLVPVQKVPFRTFKAFVLGSLKGFLQRVSSTFGNHSGIPSVVFMAFYLILLSRFFVLGLSRIFSRISRKYFI